MPRCTVLNCDGSGVHRIPKDEKMCQLWLKAIRRENLIPTKDTRLCRKHFLDSDYQKVSIYTGMEHQHKYLKKGTVPSVFSWDTQPLSKKAKAREKRLEARNHKITQPFNRPSTLPCCEDKVSDEEDDGVYLIVSQHNDKIEINSDSSKNNHLNCEAQTSNRLLSTELLLADNETVQFYTGLESPAKFSLVLSTLLPMANNINYRWSAEITLSVENQFLMLLMKLRRNTTHFELSKIVGVSKKEVLNIIATWINFVCDIWSLSDVWPSKKIVSCYMQIFFKNISSKVSAINEPNIQKLASQREHIKKLIGLTKTYLILKNELKSFYVPLASKICSICLMLSNCREGIVNKNC